MRLTAGDCRARLAAARRAVLATVNDGGSPHVVPITFAVQGDVLVTAVDAKPKRTSDLQRLRNIRANPGVAVLADHYDDDWSRLWWVRADGTAHLVTGGREHDAAVRLLEARYPQYGDQPPPGPVVRIEVHRWSGWAASGAG